MNYYGIKVFACHILGQRYGCNYKKSTSIWTNAPFLEKLALSCKCKQSGKKHVSLSGWVPIKNGKRQTSNNRPTRGTQAYPQRLCKAWAKIVAKNVATPGKV